ncbi:MAG: SMP-30/gluconolactonase/LRE family protein [Bordetella sp.]|nr:SMP-30/gluconolactonase/LRE family protein [Bordetella sp.]
MAACQRIGDMLCEVGESPLWHPAEQALYWTDIPARRLWRHDPASGANHSWALPEMAGCIARTADGWLLAMQTGIYTLPALQPGAPAGALARVAGVAHAAAQMRFNDGRCDRQGRFWAGTMMMDMAAAEPVGRLYRVAQGRLAQPLADPFLTPNGMAFSPDGRIMYVSDSHPRRPPAVWAYDYDADTGTPHTPRVFIPALASGRPDGAAVDADGCYWICGNDAGQVHRYTPAGKLDRSIALPAAKPAMCAFGGPDLATLYVTSIRPAHSAADALDGAVFALRPGVQGLEEPAYAG